MLSYRPANQRLIRHLTFRRSRSLRINFISLPQHCNEALSVVKPIKARQTRNLCRRRLDLIQASSINTITDGTLMDSDFGVLMMAMVRSKGT